MSRLRKEHHIDAHIQIYEALRQYERQFVKWYGCKPYHSQRPHACCVRCHVEVDADGTQYYKNGFIREIA